MLHAAINHWEVFYCASAYGLGRVLHSSMDLDSAFKDARPDCFYVPVFPAGDCMSFAVGSHGWSCLGLRPRPVPKFTRECTLAKLYNDHHHRIPELNQREKVSKVLSDVESSISIPS